MTVIGVTVEQFILWFDDSEASELSALNIPNSPDIYQPRIAFHLEQAEETFWTMLKCIDRDNPPNSLVNSAIRWIITIARYTLDSYNRRETVTEEYQNFLNFVEFICPINSDDSDSGIIEEIGMAAFSI